MATIIITAMIIHIGAPIKIQHQELLGTRTPLSVDKIQSELDSDPFRGEAVLLRSLGWFGTTALKEITLGFQG